MTLPVAQARALAVSAFRRAGVGEEAARAAADILTLGERMGIATHGLARVAMYCDRIAAGGIDPHAEIEVRTPAPALRHIDGHDGLGPATAMRALEEAGAAAREVGVGAAFCRGATHIGALAPYLWHASQAGFAAILTTATAPMMAPPGGRSALIGNNPLGIGLPVAGRDPVLLDMALSMVSRSRVRAARDADEAIPPDWALDADGRPTTDPAAALGGVMQAIGGAKGANLALCLDLLAGGLSGASMLGAIADQHKDPSRRQGFGLMVVLVDVAALNAAATSGAQIAEALRQVEESAPADPAVPVRLPGARALARMRQSEREGLSLPAPLLEELERLAGV